MFSDIFALPMTPIVLGAACAVLFFAVDILAGE